MKTGRMIRPAAFGNGPAFLTRLAYLTSYGHRDCAMKKKCEGDLCLILHYSGQEE